MAQRTLQHIFGKNSGIVIGAVHLPPLLGYPKFPGIDVAQRNAITDTQSFFRGGADSILFENNYDIPHHPTVSSSVVSSMAIVGARLRSMFQKPMGINVLWNDYEASLSLAKLLHLQFVRIPVFVDTVRTECGTIAGSAHYAVKHRAAIHAHDVAIFADIHVKHARLLSKHTLVASARRAIRSGADALIITGQWTGDPPSPEVLKDLRKHIGQFPLLIGSGANVKNVRDLLSIANGALVSTSLKYGAPKRGETNVKGYEQRIDRNKVVRLVHALPSGNTSRP